MVENAEVSGALWNVTARDMVGAARGPVAEWGAWEGRVPDGGAKGPVASNAGPAGMAEPALNSLVAAAWGAEGPMRELNARGRCRPRGADSDGVTPPSLRGSATQEEMETFERVSGREGPAPPKLLAGM